MSTVVALLTTSYVNAPLLSSLILEWSNCYNKAYTFGYMWLYKNILEHDK